MHNPSARCTPHRLTRRAIIPACALSVGAGWTDAPLTCEALTEAQLASAEAEAKTKMKRRVEGDLPYLEVQLRLSQTRDTLNDLSELRGRS